MLKILILGGPFLWVILVAGLAAVAVFLERWFHIHRAKIKTDDFMSGIVNILGRRGAAEAMTICGETPGPVARLVRTAVAHSGRQKAEIQRAVDDAALTEIGRLEKRFGLLATIAHIAPLLGLLGTVAGMIRVFIAIQQKAPLVPAADLAGGVWSALITTAAGLVVGIFAYAGYNILVSKTDGIILDMERSADEIILHLSGAGRREETGAP